MKTRDVAIIYDVAYPFVSGGGQRRIYEVATRLAQAGWDVTWYTLKTWDGADIRTLDGITYIGLPGHTRLYSPSGRRSIREALSFGLSIWRVRVRISQHRVIWCGQWPYFHIFGLITRCRHRLVIDWWETWGTHWIRYLGIMGVFGFLIERSAAFLFSRNARLVTLVPIARRAVIAAGARRAAVHTISNGINLEEIQRVPPAESNGRLIYVGRLKDHKNVDHILRAIAIINARGNGVISADIIGSGPELLRLQSLAEKLCVQEHVNFWGELGTEQMLAMLKAAALFIHPSTKEGGGSITLLEANACGIPVAIYRHPTGIDTSLVVDGVTGIIVEPATPAELADRIVQFLNDRGRSAECQAACVQFAQRHDWSVVSAEYERLFDSVLFALPEVQLEVK
ncbi:MAG: glycosyltransferase family 4 protein [Steroidobacteraceae bacterium]